MHAGYKCKLLQKVSITEPLTHILCFTVSNINMQVNKLVFIFCWCCYCDWCLVVHLFSSLHEIINIRMYSLILLEH